MADRQRLAGMLEKQSRWRKEWSERFFVMDEDSRHLRHVRLHGVVFDGTTCGPMQRRQGLYQILCFAACILGGALIFVGVLVWH